MPPSVDLSTSYMGFRLANPFMVGASPLIDDLDTVRRLEDAGSAAIVMHSLFEEQITASRTGRIHHLDPLDKHFDTILSYFPKPEHYALAPDEYLEHVRRIKHAVRVPVVASLNGTTAEAWLTFAQQLADAGADALEPNMYEVITDPAQSSAIVERSLIRAVRDLKQVLAIPIAVKLSPYFTALGHLAHELDHAGASALVLFNRFYQPDIDIERLSVTPRIGLSSSTELLLRLRWLAALHGRVHPSLVACGGVRLPNDGIKAILAGADAIQMVSAILQHGPAYLAVMREALSRWMDAHAFGDLDSMRGSLSLAHTPNTGAFERGHYLQTLVSCPEPPLADRASSDRRDKGDT